MTRIGVWAPRPRRVELDAGGDRFPMTRDADDWWWVDGPLGPGSDYGFVVDGMEPPLPDPRSPWQPQGVDGPSRLVDHAAFRWTDTGFHAVPLASAVIYELHIGTFSAAGTCAGAIANLDALVDLGVTHVQLMPLNEFSGDRGWGYDGVDLFAPHHAYGGPDGLKRLVDACHARGLAVLLDAVYNHAGPAGNYLDRFAPYFTTTHASPWGPAVNFDGAGSHEVRRFVLDNARMWLRDYHADGLRVDAVHAISDQSAVHIFDELTALAAHESAALGRPLVVIAESNLNDPRVVRGLEAGGHGFDAQWSDDFHHALHTTLTGERTGYYVDFRGLTDLATALRQGYVYAGQHSAYRGGAHGRPLIGVAGSRLLGYAQTHDQVGNRALGERLGMLAGPRRQKIAAALVLTAPFVPMLFQGEEWAASAPFLYFTDHRDPALAAAVRTGRARGFASFGWQLETAPDPGDPATFERSRLDWGERELGVHAEMLAWYRSLVALRRGEPELGDGDLAAVRVAVDERAQWLTLRRGSIGVGVNLAPLAQAVALPCADLLLASDPAVTGIGEVLVLPPDSVAIVRLPGGPEAGPARVA